MACESDIRDLFVVLSAAYPYIEVKPMTVQVYASLLLDLPAEVLAAAAQQVVARCKFWPTVAEIRAEALAIMEQGARPDGLPTPGEAWEEVHQALYYPGALALPALTGCSVPLQFSHPLIHKAVDALGWYELCLSENQMADRAHFFRVYEELVKRERERAALLPQVRAIIDQLADQMRPAALTPGERREIQAEQRKNGGGRRAAGEAE